MREGGDRGREERGRGVGGRGSERSGERIDMREERREKIVEREEEG